MYSLPRSGPIRPSESPSEENRRKVQDSHQTSLVERGSVSWTPVNPMNSPLGKRLGRSARELLNRMERTYRPDPSNTWICRRPPSQARIESAGSGQIASSDENSPGPDPSRPNVRTRAPSESYTRT